MKKRKKKKVTWKDLTKYLKKHNISGNDAIILLKAEMITSNLQAESMNRLIIKIEKKGGWAHEPQAPSLKLQAP